MIAAAPRHLWSPLRVFVFFSWFTLFSVGFCAANQSSFPVVYLTQAVADFDAGSVGHPPSLPPSLPPSQPSALGLVPRPLHMRSHALSVSRLPRCCCCHYLNKSVSSFFSRLCYRPSHEKLCFLAHITLSLDIYNSSVPYEKGFALLNELQRRVGVEAFHAFAKDYIAKFRSA